MGVTEADLPGGPWRVLFGHALRLLEQVETFGGRKPFFTFGGGTVLMLRYNHRLSKDIDLFVPDPQYLGFVTPRLSDMADQLRIGPSSRHVATSRRTACGSDRECAARSRCRHRRLSRRAGPWHGPPHRSGHRTGHGHRSREVSAPLGSARHSAREHRRPFALLQRDRKHRQQ
ncbi:nucleotidyl transferase AbiEii/AbiGii toxin family protein [Cupriavidus sp. AU9028]|nr:nucleotidyl transferase AbiEii/AbiGii toxin family protein [Cupriavidus sp. AU9028]